MKGADAVSLLLNQQNFALTVVFCDVFLFVLLDLTCNAVHA